MLTAAELGMLTAQKQAKDTEPKRKAKSDAAEYKKMTKDIPEEFHDIRNDMHAWLKETGKSKQDVEKSAFFKHTKHILSSPAFYGPAGGAALGGLAGAGISTAMTGNPHLGAILGGELGGTALGGLYGFLQMRSAGRKQLDALRSKRKKELSEEDIRNMQVLADMENELSPSEIQTKKIAADLGRLSAQMHHTKQAEGWSDLPSWLFSLGGNNPFFKQPQQGMGGPPVMPGFNGGRNQLPPQRGMGGAVVIPGFNGGGQMDPRLPIRPNMPANPAGDKMNPRLPIRPNMPANPAGNKMDPRFGNAPKNPVPMRMIGGDKPANAFGNAVPMRMIGEDGPVPPPFELMPAIRGKGPKGNGIKTMPAPVPTDKAPKTPAIELL
jgi:hypothetical protein